MSKNRFKKRTSKKKAVNDYQPLLMRASEAHREGRLGEAEKLYLKVLKDRPGWGQLLNALGTVYLDQNKREKAQSCFVRASNLKPPNIAACYNLARMKQQMGDHAAAVPIYLKILAAEANTGEVWNNIGVAHKEMGNREDALSSFEKAVQLAPGMAEAWNNLGVAQDENQLYTESTVSYQKAIEIRPDYPSAHFNLGCSLQKLKKYPKAMHHFQKVLEKEPEHKTAAFMLQSLDSTSGIPDAAPAEHVQRIFDQCAEDFEKVLVKDLAYKTPELLFKLVQPHLDEEMNILDLGCGTGLGAQFYRPHAKLLVGIDISTKMLAKAEEKTLYDRLESFDILCNWPITNKFDIVYSSDVFVYFGNLTPVLSSITTHLNNNGLLAFSVEKLEGKNKQYSLYPSGRYAHSQQYLENCIEDCGLQVVDIQEADIRKQSGEEVAGLLVTAKIHI